MLKMLAGVAVALALAGEPLFADGRPGVNPASSAPMPLHSEGRRANAIDLDGTWDFAVATGNEPAEAGGPAGLAWRRITLPGEPFVAGSDPLAPQVQYVWAKRTFQVTAAQAASLAVLRWNQIRFGATAFVNGVKAGENPVSGPFQTMLPAGLLKPGENAIVLKIAGAAAVPKGKSGFWLVPAGFSNESKKGVPQVLDDIWLDFADAAYIKSALAIPDLAGRKVTFRVTPVSAQPVKGLTVEAEVRSSPDLQLVGRGQAQASARPPAGPFDGEDCLVEAPMHAFRPWTPESPELYWAYVRLLRDDRVLDETTFRFGMREFRAHQGHFQLNGRNVYLHGSNLVAGCWRWACARGDEVKYLVTEAREMSLNSFRTHTEPPGRLCADICDEHGMFLLAEFPVLFNCKDFRFTAEEWAVWHENVLRDATGWMQRLWNHPSVVTWVLSNESRNDEAWETSTYFDFVRRLDPTRPIMRTESGYGTRDILDYHTCDNVTYGVEGNVLTKIPQWEGAAKGRVLTNTEYMNSFSRPRTQWSGRDDPEADELACAQLGAEHTEAMRRARLDGILPYMYAGWTNARHSLPDFRGARTWQAGYAHPWAAAWHSTLSPVLASLDLFDANYLPAQEVTTDLCLINDSWYEVPIHVDLLLTRQDPEWIPEAECFKTPLSRWSFDLTLPPDSQSLTPIRWKLPDEPGSYWLTARTTSTAWPPGVSGRAVLSQRFVRAVPAPTVPQKARQRTFVLVGDAPGAEKYFRLKDLQTTRSTDGLKPVEHVVLIWNAGALSRAQETLAKTLCDFAAAGGRVVVLGTPTWDWKQLADVQLRKTPGSRLFPYPQTQHWLLEGLDPRWLVRWNGIPGRVATGCLQGNGVAAAEKLLWVGEPASPAVAAVPAASGGGKILFCLLDVEGRLDPASPTYDPAAETLFLNILGR